MKALHKAMAISVFAILIAGGILAGVGFADGGRRFGGGGFHGQGHGDETTGQLAAWLLGAANLPVALSVFLKTINKRLALKPEAREALSGFNRAQKGVLMQLHYWLNPIALAIAGFHWTRSCCRSTSLPEWGLATMLAVGVLGLIIKFRLAPASARKPLCQLHMHPAPLLIVIALLLIGHTMMG
ncbi:MAG: hypothetical protein AB7W37_13180 [Syntrophobacteraceae bacterium]